MRREGPPKIVEEKVDLGMAERPLEVNMTTPSKAKPAFAVTPFEDPSSMTNHRRKL